MFLFVSGLGRPIELQAGDELLAGLPPLREIRDGSSQLLWAEDGFAGVTEDGTSLVVESKRPVDDRPLCSMHWDRGARRISLRRRWSGELGLYVSKKPPLIVASHLKLVTRLLGMPPGSLRRMPPGHRLRVSCGNTKTIPRPKRETTFYGRFEHTYEETVAAVREELCRSVSSLSGSVALLLSGGIDSSAIAAAARITGTPMEAFVFTLQPPLREQRFEESDLLCARHVAEYLHMPLTEIPIEEEELVHNIPLSIYLAETPRGTIIDECAALIPVARIIASRGFDTVAMGESADDLFGSFRFILRYYRGAQLKKYYRHSLSIDIPDELMILQNVLRPWKLSLVDPFWTRPLMEIGYNLPLRYRLDKAYLMKTVLRDAFADLLPAEIVSRPKCVMRDSTQVREVLAQHYGRSRERYRPAFKEVLTAGRRAATLDLFLVKESLDEAL
jgi:asparagine synthetase B (glutamine-hydrolysing)